MNIKATTTKDIPNLRALWKEAFSDNDEFLDIFFSTAFSAKRSFCIEENSKIVSALYFFDCLWKGKKIAYIYAVATAKDHRGKGLCRKLMEHTHNHLKTSGYTGAILVPGSESLFDFYAGMEYKTCCYLSKKEYSSGVSSVPLTKLTAEEYAVLRRELLPENGVIQEGENLSFLSAYAEFYSGADFLFASSKEDSTLICHEFLGNTERAPEILYSLKCKNGTLRIIGKDIPFAMYLPFEENDYPSHFGFAFD